MSSTTNIKPGHPKWCNTALDVWRFIDQGEPDECWVWTGSRVRWGYGSFKMDGKTERATRIVFALVFPTIYNPDLHILHKCDNPPCCNPLHLWQGTRADNLRDCMEKNRLARVKGEKNGNCKTTEERVLEFRRLLPLVGRKQAKAMMGFTQSQAEKIIIGKTWSHLGPIPTEDLEQARLHVPPPKRGYKQNLSDAERQRRKLHIIAINQRRAAALAAARGESK